MKIRYIADMHFDHEAIIAYDNRPFDSVSQMNDEMIRRWNAAVGADDLTWIVGDFCMGDGDRWRALLRELNGKKALIIGNHDDPESVRAAADLFEDVAEYRETADGEQKIVLCHYPIPSFKDHYFGTVHFYGHVHSAFEWNIAENSKRLLKNLYARQDVCRMANIGAMLPYMGYTPRTLEEISGQL